MACSFSRTQKRLENRTKPIAAMAKTDSGLVLGLGGYRDNAVNGSTLVQAHR